MSCIRSRMTCITWLTMRIPKAFSRMCTGMLQKRVLRMQWLVLSRDNVSGFEVPSYLRWVKENRWYLWERELSYLEVICRFQCKSGDGCL